MEIKAKLHDVKYNPNAIGAKNADGTLAFPEWTLPDTTLSRKNDSTIVLDGQEIEFGDEDGVYENISAETGGRIIEARCESGVLYLTIIAYYVGTQPVWADGEYHELEITQ